MSDALTTTPPSRPLWTKLETQGIFRGGRQRQRLNNLPNICTLVLAIITGMISVLARSSQTDIAACPGRAGVTGGG